MKILNIAPFVSSTNGFVVKSGTWKFLQDANKECFNSIIVSAIVNSVGSYSTSTLYRLWGCQVTMTIVSGTAIRNLAVTDGAIFYNGEVYLVDATTFVYGSASSSGIDVDIFTTQLTATDADPVQFTGGTPSNVHNIRKIRFSAQPLTPSPGPDLIYFATTIPPTIIDINSYGSWITPAYVNGYQSDVNSPVKYRLSGKTVRIKGKTANASPAAVITSQIMFTLPVGMRPLENQRFASCDEGNAKIVMCEVAPSGVVAMRGDAISTGNTQVYLDIAFDID